MSSVEIVIIVGCASIVGGFAAYIIGRLIDHFDPVMRRYKDALEESVRLDKMLKTLNIDLEPTEPALVVAVNGPYETSFGTVRANVQIDSRPGMYPVRGEIPAVGQVVMLCMPVDDYWYITADNIRR